MNEGQKLIGKVLLGFLAVFAALMVYGCVAEVFGAPSDELGEPIPYGDKDSLQLRIRLHDLDQLKEAIPFRMGNYKIWRLVELEKFGDNTPRNWWTHVRLDRVLVPDEKGGDDE